MSLRHETIKYCNQDCSTLYQIIEKFAINIFNLYNLNISNYPTTPSLSVAIYRSNFRSKKKFHKFKVNFILILLILRSCVILQTQTERQKHIQGSCRLLHS